MAKKPTSFLLSDEVKQTLKKLAEIDKRSQATMIEILVEAAGKKAGIKPDKPAPKK